LFTKNVSVFSVCSVVESYSTSSWYSAGSAMNDFIDRGTRWWAVLAVVVGMSLYIGLELREEPDMSPLDLALSLLEIAPVVLTSVGLALLFKVTYRQREEQRTLIHDLEIARVQGQRWRNDARTLINGLGDAIEAQFTRWSLTEAEREVALLLLKGLSLKEIAAVRATNERTVRAQCRSL
jgi:hypothetical protein